MAVDRHKHANYPYRPTPPDLLKQVDEVMGPGRRSVLISELLARFLAGERMPTPAVLAKKWDKPGQDHGE